MSDERRTLTPDEFGELVSAIARLAQSEPDLSAWGAAHASAFAGISETHPEHVKAARRAYAERLRTLRGEPK